MSKKLIRTEYILGVGIFCFWIWYVIIPVYADEVINASEYEDSRLYDYVIDNYDTNKNGQLEVSEAEAVEYIALYCSDISEGGDISDLTSLKGVEHFVNLTGFSLQGRTGIPITDISPLKNLTKLTWLTIRQQWYIEDFSVLSGLVNLESLDLVNTNCSDVSFLKNMTKLKRLEMWDGNLKNTDVISRLVNLERLDLRSCGLMDISFVRNLKNLQYVELGENNISDFTPLIDIKDSLTYLYFGGYDISYKLELNELMFLTQMTNLEFLWMADSGIEQIPDLTGLSKLNRIYLGQNYLTIEHVEPRLPVSITSQENWIADSAMDDQHEKVTVETTTQSTTGVTTVITEKTTSESTEEFIDETTGELTEDSTDETTGESTEDSTDETTGESQGKPTDKSTGETSYRVKGESTATILTTIDKNQQTTNNEETTIPMDMEETVEQEGDYDIKVVGDFGCKVDVTATEIRNIKSYNKIINELLEKYMDATDINVYDIAVINAETGEEVSPNGRAKISLRIDVVEGATYKVFEVVSENEWKEIDSSISEDKIHFFSENIDKFAVMTIDSSSEGNDELKKAFDENDDLIDKIVFGGIAILLIGSGIVVYKYGKTRKMEK